MARVTLIWEMGADLGHVYHLHGLAKALRQRGHKVTLILKELDRFKALFHRDIKAGLYTIIQGPSLEAPKARKLSREPASFTELLLAQGFNKPVLLSRHLAQWRTLLISLKSDALVFDFAPSALIASQHIECLKIQYSAPFSTPPLTDTLPSFGLNPSVNLQNLQLSEARFMEQVNTALQAAHLPEALSNAALYNVDKTFIHSIPEIDPYALLRTNEQYVSPRPMAGGRAIDWLPEPAQKVFGYLKPSYSQLPQLLKHLDRRDLQSQLFIPGFATGTSDAPTTSNIHTSSAPLSLNMALTDCRFTICHGGHGTVLQSVLQGAPCLIIPQQQEQLMTAHRCIHSGIGVGLGPQVADANKVTKAINTLCNDDGYQKRARACKEKYRSLLAQSAEDTVIDAIEDSL
jgi:hypothetical protein